MARRHLNAERRSSAGTARRGELWPILVSMALLGSANSVLFAITPPAGRRLGLVEWQIGLIVALSALVYMVSAAVWGRLSDLKGRRYVLAVGMLGFGIGGAAFAFTLDLGLLGVMAPSLALVLLIAVRMVQSLVSAGAFPAGQAHIAENAAPEQRAVALSALTSSFALGTVLGPAIAGLLAVVWLTLPLYAIALASVAASLWVVLAMPKLPPAASAARPRLSVRDPRVAGWLGVAMLHFLAIAGTQQVLAFAVQDRLRLDAAATAATTSWIFMATGVVAILFQVAVVRRSAWSFGVLMAIGLVAAAAAQAWLLAASSDWQFILIALPFGISMACVAPGVSAAVSLSVGAEEQGAAAGLIAAAQAAGFLVGPLLFAVTYRELPALPFAMALAIAIVLLVYVGLRSRTISLPD